MCIRDRVITRYHHEALRARVVDAVEHDGRFGFRAVQGFCAVSYTHLRAHETVLDLVCRLLLEKKKTNTIVQEVQLDGTTR